MNIKPLERTPLPELRDKMRKVGIMRWKASKEEQYPFPYPFWIIKITIMDMPLRDTDVLHARVFLENDLYIHLERGKENYYERLHIPVFEDEKVAVWRGQDRSDINMYVINLKAYNKRDVPSSFMPNLGPGIKISNGLNPRRRRQV